MTDNEALAAFLAQARWFSGKDRSWSIVRVFDHGDVPGRVDGEPFTQIVVAEVAYEDGSHEFYHVPLALYPDEHPELAHAFVGSWPDDRLDTAFAYDAIHDAKAMAGWLRSFRQADGSGALRFHRVDDREIATNAPGTAHAGEQSNSSIIFGDEVVLKIFRKIAVGINPEIDILTNLTRAHAAHIADLLGWNEIASPDGGVIQTGLLQQFVTDAVDGWDFALDRTRMLIQDSSHYAELTDGDIAGEAMHLGAALASVHAMLAKQFPVEELDHFGAEALSALMHDRLTDAVAIVPALATYEPRLRETFDAVSRLDVIEIQRIHGDLHLGQALLGVDGWTLVDFEGEPDKPLSERSHLDSPWRDVAGVVRSFDYAAQVALRTHSGPEKEVADALSRWSNAARSNFLVGYTSARGTRVSSTDRAVLNAYIADKAIYEVVYETRNRPGWVDIPLGAVARLGSA